jgi:hypothetical protein
MNFPNLAPTWNDWGQGEERHHGFIKDGGFYRMRVIIVDMLTLECVV